MNIKVIAFDADDTLWVNEPYFQAAEKKFCALLADYLPAEAAAKELFRTEMENLAAYGYGVKGFMLSMTETALRVSGGRCGGSVIERTIQLGKELLEKPIELLPGVEEVLKTLKNRFRLVAATKGDLLDQERKLKRSGIERYFHHIEIMSDKREEDYRELIKHLDIRSSQFLMLGNSVKSDILPVLAAGGHAVHIPYHTVWAHEHSEQKVEHRNFRRVDRITDVLPMLIPDKRRRTERDYGRKMR